MEQEIRSDNLNDSWFPSKEAEFNLDIAGEEYHTYLDGLHERVRTLVDEGVVDEQVANELLERATVCQLEDFLVKQNEKYNSKN